MITSRDRIYDKMYLMRNDFGDWLRQERERRGLSQSDLARLASIHRSVINKLETGTIPTPETLQSLGKGLKISLENVYRAAGLLPPVPEITEQKEELNYLFDQLSKEKKKDLLNYAQFLLAKKD